VRRASSSRSIGIVALALVGGGPAAAQLPSASARALGMGDSYTALARGYSTVAWNPAGLAMPDGPGTSLVVLLPVVRSGAGVGPIGAGEFSRRGGELLSDDVKRRWFARIAGAGSERGAASADVTYFALGVGRVAVQLSSRADVSATIPADVMEVMLFGNAGRLPGRQDASRRAMAIDLSATSTLAASYGHPIRLSGHPGGDQRLGVGATLKYTVGHAFARGRSAGSALTSDPGRLHARFPLVQTETSYHGVGDLWKGGGVGVDVGAMWQRRGWTVGLAAQNVLDTFRWDTGRLRFRRAEALVDGDRTSSDFELRPFADAPPALRRKVATLSFRPALAAGVSARLTPRLTVSSDLRRQFGDGIGTGVASHVGAGAEYRMLRFLPVRGGVAVVTGGYQAGGGLAIELGPVDVALSAIARRTETFGAGGVAMLGIVIGDR
jgi:hypothetical protein